MLSGGCVGGGELQMSWYGGLNLGKEFNFADLGALSTKGFAALEVMELSLEPGHGLPEKEHLAWSRVGVRRSVLRSPSWEIEE